MGLSSKLFLLSADDTVHALSNAAFMRMLRQESVARIPEFAGQRVRQVSMVVAVVNGAPTQIVRCTFAILDIDGDGVLDVERWNAQQFARVDDPFEPAGPGRGTGGPIVDATRRFVARGEVPMGLVNHYYVTETLAEDPATPIAAHRFPGDDPGSLFLVATASVPAPAADNAQAIALIDFLLSDEGQKLIVEGEGEYPVVEGVALEQGTPSLTESDYPSYDLTGVTDHKAISDQIKGSGLAK